MRCEDCKYWANSKDEHDASDVKGIELGRCKRVKMFWDATDWDWDADNRVLMDGYENDKAFLQDGSDYRADLITAKEFGCVQFERKITINPI